MKKLFTISLIITAVFGLPTERTGNSVERNVYGSNQKTLAEWIENFERKFETSRTDSRIEPVVNDINMDCVKSKLKFPVNAQRQFKKAQFLTIVEIASYKCQQNKTEAEAYTEVFKNYLNSYRNMAPPRYMECFQLELQKIDPTSKLVENFDASAMTISSSECERKIDINGVTRFIENIEQQTEPFSVLTCGHLTADEIKKIIVTAMVLGFEDNEELKGEETEKLKTKMMAKYNRIFECIVEGL